tara:strand:+ start:49 stop:465 length:417 start_codon:yes stop_codon:yes gene_type:complete
MAQQTTITGIRGLTSKTWYNQPPVEWGRSGGAVATIALGTATGDNGTSGAGSAVDAAATTSTGPATRSTTPTAPTGGGSGLKVDLAVGGDVVTAITVDAGADNDGDGYRVGDKIVVTAANASTATDVVGYVTSLEYEN